MLFTSSFKLISVAAFILPALLVGASPHSLSERAGNDGVVRHVTFHEQCPPNSNSADCPDPVKITLIPRQGEYNVFDVEGGWKGQPAIAEATPSFMEARKWTREDANTLAFGNDGGELDNSQLMYYVIFKNGEELDDSDGSGDTIKG